MRVLETSITPLVYQTRRWRSVPVHSQVLYMAAASSEGYGCGNVLQVKTLMKREWASIPHKNLKTERNDLKKVFLTIAMLILPIRTPSLYFTCQIEFTSLEAMKYCWSSVEKCLTLKLFTVRVCSYKKGTLLNNTQIHRIRKYKSDHSEMNHKSMFITG